MSKMSKLIVLHGKMVMMAVVSVFMVAGVGNSMANAWECSFPRQRAVDNHPLASDAIRAYSTLHSIGIEWDLEGDANHNATATVQYREAPGISEIWGAYSSPVRDALDLLRVDYYGRWDSAMCARDGVFNMLAGSIFFLKPGTRYLVRIQLTDSDGGSATRVVAVTTRDIPSLPTGGTIRHVTDDGQPPPDLNEGEPVYHGFEAAQADVAPGDIVLVHGGDYTGGASAGSAVMKNIELNISGEAGVNGEPARYIVWKAAGDGDVKVDRIHIRAHHVWIEGFLFQNRVCKGADYAAIYALGWETRFNISDVVLLRNQIYGYHYSIYLYKMGYHEGDEVQEPNRGGNWYIAYNHIIGDAAPDYIEAELCYHCDDYRKGEGIELGQTDGHVVAYNSISYTKDAISYPRYNCDIYGNDIHHIIDDGIEMDYGYNNIRIWGNRIHKVQNSALSFQPQYGGPWYIFRNQFNTGSGAKVFKFNVAGRFWFAHNTIVLQGSQLYAQHMLRSKSRNNLWMQGDCSGNLWTSAVQSEYPDYVSLDAWRVIPYWRSDLDYDGFDLEGTCGPKGINWWLESYHPRDYAWLTLAPPTDPETQGADGDGGEGIGATEKFTRVYTTLSNPAGTGFVDDINNELDRVYGTDNADKPVFEAHAVSVNHTIFAFAAGQGIGPDDISPQYLRLDASAEMNAAIDTGEVLKNVTEGYYNFVEYLKTNDLTYLDYSTPGYTGSHPDLGAHEAGMPDVPYGMVMDADNE